eukprot:scpid81554/ scgid3843/ 
MSVIKKLKFRISQLKSAADCQTSPESSTCTNKSDDDSVVKLMQSQMKELLTIHRQTQEHTQSLLQQHSESLTTQASHKSTVNLPKLGLPKFNGDILQWKSFHDMFMASVHKHTGLSDVQKLSYLKEHVTHNALDTISGLSLSDANYAVALSLLTLSSSRRNCLAATGALDESKKYTPAVMATSALPPSSLRTNVPSSGQ